MESDKTDVSWSPQLVDLGQVEDAFSFEEGFTRPNWKTIHNVVAQSICPGDLNAAWNEVAMQWLLQLRDDLGGEYRVDSSTNFLLLSALAWSVAEPILIFAEQALERIEATLGEAAWRPEAGKHLLLVFSEEDDYYQYISHFYPEGNHPLSGGCLVSGGYVHIAMQCRDGYQVRHTVAHELTHNCVVHLPLPRWLNEGLAMLFERTLTTSYHPVVDHDLRERHFAFWNPENIQKFWAGLSFFEPGDPVELSYSLAEILANLLLEHKQGFAAFVQHCDRRDAGQTAALDFLGIDLGTLVGTFLGEGNWRPHRKAMVELWKAAEARHKERQSQDSGAGERPGKAPDRSQ